jgi:hypothetical protein
MLCCLCQTPLLAWDMSHRTRGYAARLEYLRFNLPCNLHWKPEMRTNFNPILPCLQFSRWAAGPQQCCAASSDLKTGLSPFQRSEPRLEEAKSLPNALERLNFDAQPHHVM